MEPKRSKNVRSAARDLRALFLLASAFAVASNGRAAPPSTVSPGGVERVERSASHCPTFSWGTSAAVEAWDLAVYRLVAEATANTEAEWEPVLSRRLPGGVSSWTPSLDDCLDASETYAWFVGTPDGVWSEGRLFEVAEPPALEMERVLARVRERLGEAPSTDGVERGERPTSPAPHPPVPARAVSQVVATGFGVDTQGIAWGNGFILRCGAGSASSYYLDVDQDGFGDAANLALACVQPNGYSTSAGDCDDGDDLIHPSAPDVCGDGIDNDCDGTSIGAGQACFTGLVGVCSDGITSCAGNEVVCDQSVLASPETCNGFDDDCDGPIDEDLVQQCFDGNPAQIGIGICKAGVQSCVEGGYGSCVDQVLPTEEVCNGLDDDCDGQEDNGGVCD
jgi:hypothetical protein